MHGDVGAQVVDRNVDENMSANFYGVRMAMSERWLKTKKMIRILIVVKA